MKKDLKYFNFISAQYKLQEILMGHPECLQFNRATNLNPQLNVILSSTRGAFTIQSVVPQGETCSFWTYVASINSRRNKLIDLQDGRHPFL